MDTSGPHLYIVKGSFFPPPSTNNVVPSFRYMELLGGSLSGEATNHDL
eukprot:CAMPEP_0184384198 /NCGR_PEP_ID=MMETSP0007-20130409/7740_1 /TAXON_ID=97485 /ORGANISM="Prymnesium parvum, Strain Texoma1" /LENGTH=47 /DNA_ID= /DNA_START= /DNA_END= /DNA_ORIENTATION=